MAYKDQEKRRKAQQRYEERNRAKRIEAQRIYKENNKEKSRESQHKYRLANKEKINKYHRRWCKTPTGRLCKQQSRNKRRALKFIPLNEYFEDSEAHHINDNEVVYIPKELHEQYPHNHKKIETMVVINAAVVRWLQSIYPYKCQKFVRASAQPIQKIARLDQMP